MIIMVRLFWSPFLETVVAMEIVVMETGIREPVVAMETVFAMETVVMETVIRKTVVTIWKH